MSKHLFWVAGLPLILGGCLPIPISIASSAITGISYLTTGKSGTDHVISAAREEDCSLTNPLFGDDICQDVQLGEEPYLVVAAYPGDRDNGGPSSRGRALVAPSGEADAIAAADSANAGHQEKLAALSTFMAPPPEITVAGLSLSSDRMAQLSGRAVVVETANAATSTTWASTQTSPKIPTRSVELAPLPAPTGFDAPTPSKIDQAALTGSVGVSGTKVPLANPQPVGQPKPSDVAKKNDGGPAENDQPALPRVELGSMGASGRYIVIGSFRDRGRADRLAETVADHAPKILAATVNGERWNRVAIGPFSEAQVSQTKAAIGTVSGRQPWVIRLQNPIILAGN
jgi:hypothetical protein